MWYIKGFVPGFGYVTSQYCCWKRQDAEDLVKVLEKKHGFSHLKVVYKRRAA